MRRLSKVTERRTQLDWAIFVQDIAASYPEPERIALVMDNLNTHTPGSLHEAFAPQKARALWERFEFARTPKHGSWLNMAEIEINVMVSQCLDRRIDSIETVRSGVAAWQARRDNLQAKVNWQLTTRDARIKLKRLYPTNCLGATLGSRISASRRLSSRRCCPSSPFVPCLRPASLRTHPQPLSVLRIS